MTQRVYIDTSVVGGAFDTEFDFFTKMFFDKAFRKEIILVVSDLLEEELLQAPPAVQAFFKSLPTDQLEEVRQTLAAIELAELYIQEGVVGETSRADCRHIALATINKVDVLVSWNFKHIVNLSGFVAIIQLICEKVCIPWRLDRQKS